MLNNGTYLINGFSAFSVNMSPIEPHIRQKRFCNQPVNLHGVGLRTKRIEPCPAEYAGLKNGRLSERIVEEFEVAKHLADLVSVLTAK